MIGPGICKALAVPGTVDPGPDGTEQHSKSQKTHDGCEFVTAVPLYVSRKYLADTSK